MASARKPLRARVTFACEHEGGEHLVHAGDVLAATDPRVKGREELFAPAEPQPAPVPKPRRSRKAG